MTTIRTNTTTCYPDNNIGDAQRRSAMVRGISLIATWFVIMPLGATAEGDMRYNDTATGCNATMIMYVLIVRCLSCWCVVMTMVVCYGEISGGGDSGSIP